MPIRTLVAAVVFLAASEGRAYVEVPYTLGHTCGDSTNVVLLEVTRVNKDRNLILYKKVRDLKGTHPEDVVKHNIGQNGYHPREWQNIKAWAEPGKRAVFFHNGNASETCIGTYWYQCQHAGDWWNLTHAEPFLLRTSYGDVDRLAVAVTAVVAGKEVVISCLADGNKEDLHLRKGKVQRLKASLARQEYDARRDFVGWGFGDPPAVAVVKPAPPKPVTGPSATVPTDRSWRMPPGKGGPGPGLAVDRARRTVTLPCAIAPRKLAYLNAVYPIEVMATYPHPRGQKAHETVVVFENVRPSDVHKALEGLGLKPGQPARGEDGKGVGPELRLFLEFAGTNGQVQRLDLGKTLVNPATGQRLPPVTWHFTGSVLRRPDPEKDEQAYGADLTGTLIALFPVTNEVVIQSSLTMKDEPVLKLETDSTVLPREGTPVRLAIEAAPASVAGDSPDRLGGYRDIVWAVSVSPDGKQVLAAGGGNCVDGRWVAGSDYAVRLWDAGSGRELKRFEGHRGAVNSIAWSPDGRLAFWNSGDAVRVWDVVRGQEQQPFANAGPVVALSLSGDGRRLLTGGWDRTVRLWDVGSRKELRRFAGHTGRVWDVALSPDGRRAASCGDEVVVRVWDAATGKEERQLRGHDAPVVRVAFSPDGRCLLSGAWDNTARLWEAGTGRQIQVFAGHTGRVEGVAFSPDGGRVVTGSLDGTVRLWDAAGGKEVCCWKEHTAAVARVAFSPDGRIVVSGGWDKTARVWHLPGDAVGMRPR
jgi:hypothetical protein